MVHSDLNSPDSSSREPADEDVPPLDEMDYSADDLEAAYMRALDVLDQAEAAAVESTHLDEPQVTTESRKSPESQSTDLPETNDAEPLSTIKPMHVIEAALFVGGPPLTSKKLASLFDAHIEHFLIDGLIDELNQLYSDQGRPYEIRLTEGGYRLVLREDFEGLRRKVYGVGPREVKLSQDTLEVLALVAYQQPLSHRQLLQSGKKNVGNLVRNLVRRELVCLERTGKKGDDVLYKTTPRFLTLFGLRGLTDLPHIDDLALR